MTTPFLTWASIVALFIILLLVRLFHTANNASKGSHHLFSFGTDREEFFIPGDPDPKNIDNYDFDDTEDY